VSASAVWPNSWARGTCTVDGSPSLSSAPTANRTGASDVQRLLDASGSGATVVGVFVEDAKGALRLRYDLAGVPARSVVLRSAGVVGARVRELAGHDLTAAMGGLIVTDQLLLRRLREDVADIVSRQRREDAANGVPPMSSEDERQFGRAVISRVLETHARTEMAGGRTPPTMEEEAELADGIHAALFGVGRLQPLLDDPMVENVDINGCDRVFVGYADGREEMVAPIAESDDELIELVQVLAVYSGLTSRPFDTANPQLDLRLPDGSRLSAVMGVTARPSLSIRRARLSRVFLDDLVVNGVDEQRDCRVPLGGRPGPQEHHDRGGHQRRKDHAAAGLGQRDPPQRTPHHR
jgi:hypothetical protein